MAARISGVGRLQVLLLKSIIRSPEYLPAGRCERRFESFSEVVRYEKLHRFAHVLGSGGPHRGFEAAACEPFWPNQAMAMWLPLFL